MQGGRRRRRLSQTKIQIPIVAAMSSLGVFRKVEMDEKPFLVYTLTHTDTSSEALAMDSGGHDFPLPPSFFCPLARARFQKLRLMEEDNLKDEDDDDACRVYDDDVVHKEFLPFDSSLHFRSTRREAESLLDCKDSYICKLPVVPIFWCNNEESDFRDFECGVCKFPTLSVSYYACLQCEKMFHKECVEFPLEIKHPYHPFHSLQLRTPVHSLGDWSVCTSCGEYLRDMSYDCTICELRLHLVCAIEPVPFVVDHPKSHPHPLTLFPTQDSLVCHVCSLILKLDPTYICIQCVFVIHESCIGFPHVIRMSRHPHRISFTSSLPSEIFSCGVCRQQVDNTYGAYSCNRCDAYFVHSKCALHRKVWDGIELEGVPEEEDMIDDGEPFERIADGIILHPFHSHNLRLEIFIAYDENKFCRGCALSIYQGQFYSCMECDYILHESCANAPRMIRHPLDPQPLKLYSMRFEGIERTVNHCTACRRDLAGFIYTPQDSQFKQIELDLRCASIIEPFEYEGHKHPLFLPWDPEEEERRVRCQICKTEYENRLICLECDYAICFCCATLPYKVRYKHDSHFLMICDGKEGSDQPDWCEICEGKIQQVKQREHVSWMFVKNEESRFYKCNDCSTTLHVECLLGVDIYLKAGKTISNFVILFEETHATEVVDAKILLNSSLSRPICDRCYRRCPFPIYFKVKLRDFCSWYCTKEAEWYEDRP